MKVLFKVLGPLEVIVDGTPVTLGGARQRAVLGVLLLDPGRLVPAERIIELIWGEDPGPKTGGTLQVYVSNLRRLLDHVSAERGRPIIVTQRPGYSVDLEPDELDLTELRSLLGTADAATSGNDPHSAANALRRAASLFRGPALADLDPALAPVTAPIGELRTSVLGRLATTELELGRHREIIDDLRAWSAAHPYDEALRGQLMLALYRSGRQTEALRAFSEGRDLLIEELGIEPSRELRALESAILDQDAALDLAEGAGGRHPSPSFNFVDQTELRSEVGSPAAYLDHDGASVPLDRAVVTIGRHPDRQVVLLDRRASRLHAEVRLVDGRHLLRDLDSANGTLVNGESVHEIELSDGDALEIGDSILVFRLEPHVTSKPTSTTDS